MNSAKITVRQMAILVFFCVIGDSILIGPSLIAAYAKEDAWISGLVGIAAGIALAALLYRVGHLEPGCSLVQLNRLLLGKWVGGAVSLFFIVFFVLNVGTMTRSIGDFVTTQMMPETPIRAIHALLALLLGWALHGGIEMIGRAAGLFFPWFVFGLFALLVCLVPKVEFDQIVPVMGHGVLPVLNGSAYMLLFPFGEMVALLMLFPYVADAPHTRRDFLVATGLGGLAIWFIILFCLFVLGPYITGHQAYPTYALAKKISIGRFLERVEAILAFLWIISLFFKIILYGYAFLSGLSQLFLLRDEKLLALPSLFLFFGLSYVVSPNIVYFNDTLVRRYWPYWDLTNAIAVPLLLLLVHAVRSGRGKEKASSA